ncbi:MAG: hypothetical protein K8U03_03500 [Planctomycetia bacterium]|nr:hypothetical protein [Planctomycetia bacterium]
MLLLSQFLYRLSFGMAAAMAITPARLVTSGYYRNNLYVLLGMNLLVALAAWGGAATEPSASRFPATAALILCYVGSALWLYEKPRLGIAALVAVAGSTLFGVFATTQATDKPASLVALAYADSLASGLLLGATMAAMLLGHWYLNAPGMRIQPLFRLTACMAGALVLRTIVSGIGFAGSMSAGVAFENAQWFMLALRWLAGIFGTAGLIAMTWSTLKIPNTQAATGMLYVAVITTFLGELLGQLLSVGSLYPL